MATTTELSAYDHHRGAEPLLRPAGRWRAGIFLAIGLVLFGVACAFWQYLATGRWLDLSLASYRRELTTPIADMLTQPLSIFTHPWVILVAAGLLAILFLTPVIVAVLYHELCALAFALVLGVIGHAWLLALFQAAGCILAARTRLRSDLPFLAVLLGMVPLGVYLYLTFGVADYPAALPLQRWVFYAPVAIAVVTALVASAIVLALAKIARFRPGVLWPVLALLLAAPVAIFYTRIGPDELEYVLIVEGIAERPDAIFESIELDNWQRRHQAQGLNRYTLRTRIGENLEIRKRRLIQRCEQFLAGHPESERAAAVLWVEAQAQSLLLDEAAYQAGLVKYNAAPAATAAQATWERLANDYGGTPHAALAGYRMGELALRAGRIRQANELLHTADHRLRTLLLNAAARPRVNEPFQVFATARAVPAQRNYEYYENALLNVERLIWLMEENQVLKDPRSAQALSEYLGLNPRGLDYPERLAALAGQYEDTRMGDNLKLAVALTTPDEYERAAMLIHLSENKLTDAAIEANFALGRLAMQTVRAPALPLLEKLKRPEQYFKAVIAARDNPWQRRSAAHLEWLAARPRQQ